MLSTYHHIYKIYYLASDNEDSFYIQISIFLKCLFVLCTLYLHLLYNDHNFFFLPSFLPSFVPSLVCYVGTWRREEVIQRIINYKTLMEEKEREKEAKERGKGKQGRQGNKREGKEKKGKRERRTSVEHDTHRYVLCIFRKNVKPSEGRHGLLKKGRL